jgi:hypothetical protein
VGFAKDCIRLAAVPFRDSQRRIVLPDGVLRRFRLPEAVEGALPSAPRRRRSAWLLVLLWAVLTLVLFQWSEGRVSARSWLDSLGNAFTALRTLGAPSQNAVRPTAPRTLASAPVQESAASATPGPIAERAALVSGPVSVKAPNAILPIHSGAFTVARDEAPPARAAEVAEPTQAELSEVSHIASDNAEVYAGPGCDGARRGFAEDFLEEKEDEEIKTLLGKRSLYEHCRPEMLRVCALVHKGRAVGVTVQTEPPSRSVGVCAAIVAKLLHYPRLKRPQMVRTEVYFR